MPDNAPVVEPVTPAEGQQPQDGDSKAKITYSLEQQEHINLLIKDAQSRAARELRIERDELRRQIKAAKVQEPPIDVALKLAEREAELTALKSEREATTIRETLRAAAGAQFLDTDLAVRLMHDNVKVIDGAVRAVDESGNLRLNASFEPMTLRELAAELASQKPFLARAEVRGGVGSKPAQNHTSNAVPLERLFGKNSSGGEANRLAMHDPQTYRRLKAAAHERGLV